MSKTRDEYLENLEVGLLIAFKNDGKMISAKVIEIHDDQVKVETKNGSMYFVKKENIAWIKTGKRWPKGIFNALRNNVMTNE